VALSDIVKTVGGITSNDAVKISAKDGYSMTLSYNQVNETAPDSQHTIAPPVKK